MVSRQLRIPEKHGRDSVRGPENVLVIVGRRPVAGRTKTRLGTEIGHEAARYAQSVGRSIPCGWSWRGGASNSGGGRCVTRRGC